MHLHQVLTPVPAQAHGHGRSALAAGLAATLLALGGCGGGGVSDVLGNPPSVANNTAKAGQYLSFPYFQRCVLPVLLAQLPVVRNGLVRLDGCCNQISV